MRIKKNIVFVLCVVLLSLCCAKKEATSYITEIIDGVTVVQNLRLNPEAAYKELAFAEDLRIGVEEGEDDYMLYSPVDIDADPDGNIYILDMRDSQVKKYDPEGQFIGNIGRKGQGPGEFDRPNNMELDSIDRILVADPYQRRFEFLARGGNYIKSVRMESYVTSLACGKDGLILIGYGWDESDGSQEYRIGRFCGETGEVTDLFSQKQYWPARLMNDQLRYDFPYFVRTAIDSQNRIIVGVGIDYEIRVLRSNGELEFKFSKVHDKIPVKGEMLEQISNITLKGRNPYVQNPYFPVFESLSIDEEDNIWIQHHQPKWVGKINTETVYDVFSPKGIFQFMTKIPGHIIRSLKFKNGCIYALKLKDEGFIVAVRLRY
ncbi:MAG: 6-bladed beta-propeller [Candidatus Aminicenantes bacterium]|nr:MAG: 6-bladed beta-propeller [Candidatus Aminicenantes bacterium]